MSLYAQGLLDVHAELIVDLFAGGGGASSGIEQALGRMVDIAINHDARAVALHQANHPQTLHYVSDVFEVDPRTATNGRPVALLWGSPDCTYHSKARGSKPIRDANKKRRALAWVITRWAGQVRPRIIFLENVEEFAQWGPLVGKTDELRPCPKRRGNTFRTWKRSLERLGYVVEHRELAACDYGSPTIRKRLFVIARCDGQPIVWPEATHGAGLKPFRTVAECIDWSVPMCSIFATKEEAKTWAKEHGFKNSPIRPLKENTMRRIARGVQKFVLNGKPFLIELTHQGNRRQKPLDEPMHTITCAKRGETALVSPFLSTYYGDKPGAGVRGQELSEPMATQTTENRHALVAAFLSQNNGGFYEGAGRPMSEPISTILVNGRGHQPLIAAHIQRDFGQSIGSSVSEPVGTVTPNGGGKAALVASFLAQYNGTAIGQAINDPLKTVSTVDRFGFVAVEVKGEPFYIAHIAMRMLTPRELYSCQGFRPEYIIDRTATGEPLTKTEQVRMVGNSVCPPVAEAIVRANCADLIVRQSTPISSFAK